METWRTVSVADCAVRQGRPGMQQQPASRPSFLYLVTAHEVEEMRQALARGALPPDFEAKLSRLAGGDLMQSCLVRSCHCFMALVSAAQAGAFKEGRPADCERLLRVLAYVRKDDDAVADYKPGGFMDDQHEVHAATVELGPLLKTFKAWRLRHQVPGLWMN